MSLILIIDIIYWTLLLLYYEKSCTVIILRESFIFTFCKLCFIYCELNTLYKLGM